MIIIGVAGGTGSGKTTVVRKIMERLPKGEVGVISQDSYYKDSSHVPVEERQKINFDEPNAFDWELLLEHLQKLKKGQAVEMPTYSYLTCTRQAETEHMDLHDVVLVEGILVLTDRRLRNMMDIKVFVDADGDHGIPAAWLMHNALTAYAADRIEDSVVEISWDQPHSPAEIDVQDLYNYIDGIVAREAQ